MNSKMMLWTVSWLSLKTKVEPGEDHVWFEDRWMVASLCDE
jgi:hypothetical protein